MIVQPGESSAAWLRLAAECAQGMGSHAVVIGTGGDVRRAQEHGLTIAGSCAPLMRSSLLGWRTVVKQCGSLLRNQTAVAWSAQSAALGRECAKSIVAIAEVPLRCPQARLLFQRRTAALPKIGSLIPFAPGAQEGWDASCAWQVHQPVTALPTLAASASREECRMAWGLGEQDVAVALLGGLAGGADALRAVDIVGRSALMLGAHASKRMALIVHPEAARVPAAIHWAAATPTLVRVIVDRRISCPWQVAAGLDAALCAEAVTDLSPALDRSALTWALRTRATSSHHSAAGPLEALIMARHGVPVISTQQSGAAACLAEFPGLTFCQRRATLGSRTLFGIVQGQRGACDPLWAFAASRPAAQELQASIERAAGIQRAAA